MIILGLGSNIGDRLHFLRQALVAIKDLPGITVHRVSPVYISDAQLPTLAPADWNQHFLNCALCCESSLTPQELLDAVKKIEQHLGRDNQPARWSPRVIDIDILSWHDILIAEDALTIPHPHLLYRPFALWPLADLIPGWRHPQWSQTAEQCVEAWGSRYAGEAPFHTRQLNQRIDTPRLVGIINVTPNSFSDGGHFSSREQAFDQAVHIMEAGAEILDIGAESTAPGTDRITPETEWQRLLPVLSDILQAKENFMIPPVISV